jgi:hypothetical protein
MSHGIGAAVERKQAEDSTWVLEDTALDDDFLLLFANGRDIVSRTTG